MRESITRWVEIAEERLTGSCVELYAMPGNDDELFVDELTPASTSRTATAAE